MELFFHIVCNENVKPSDISSARASIDVLRWKEQWIPNKERFSETQKTAACFISKHNLFPRTCTPSIVFPILNLNTVVRGEVVLQNVWLKKSCKLNHKQRNAESNLIFDSCRNVILSKFEFLYWSLNYRSVLFFQVIPSKSLQTIQTRFIEPVSTHIFSLGRFF